MSREIAGAAGREVACRSFGRILVEWDRAGMSPADLVAGSGCTVEQIYDKRQRISWSSYRAIMANSRRLWDDDGLIELGVRIHDTPWAKHVTIPARLLATAPDFYRWMVRPGSGVAQQMFTCVEHRLRDVEPGWLQMLSTMAPGYPPCREFFLITRGSLVVLPTLLGLPRARVEMEEAAGGATYDIHYPQGGGSLAWLRRFVTRPFSDPSAAREIEEVHVELHERNQELESKNRELELRNAELERYAFTVSHDLKSPLVTIKGFLGALEKDVAAGDAERVRHDLGQIHRAADRMRRLMTELLELSRVGHASPPHEEVALSAVAAEAVDLVAAAIGERGVAVAIEPAMPMVLGDRLRLLEVYQNLIENAVRFMGEQPAPRVEIGARPGEQETVCYVRDNGIGIEPRYQQQVFGLFERLDPADDGTGIGLALVKRIVEMHGGRVWVESAGAGRGTTLCFALPHRRRGGVPGPDPGAPQPDPATGSRSDPP